MKQATVIDVRQFVDEQPFSRFQLLVAVLCGALVFMDGFDAQAMGFVATSLTAQLKITRAALGQVISTGLFGMMIGALVCGPLADRFGRKPVLVACSFIFGIGSLLTATATSLQTLFLFRLFTGLGLGGAMPNAIALTSEYAPKRYRATTVMTMFTGFSIGAAVGGLVAAGLITRFGWQSIFVVGGILPCLIGLIALALLPESIRFLVLKGGSKARVTRYLSRISPGSGPFDEVVVGADEHRSGTFVVKQLFMEHRAKITLLLWVMFFMNLLNLYFLNSWLPTVINDNGIRVETAIIITSLFQVGGAAGALLLGRLVDRLLSFTVLAWAYLGAAASVFLIGEAGASVLLLILTVSLAGFCVIGGQTSSNALAAEFYPTAIRSTGVGWALGIGRIGSIIGPSLGGALLSTGGQTRQVFWAAAIPALIATVAAFTAASFIRKERR
ncbi:MAG TPA: MFS transporter [Terriglobia bacterium]|nr:MFS transporter [Terriglobia bacterium]